jgi:hypothetical protein
VANLNLWRVERRQIFVANLNLWRDERRQIFAASLYLWRVERCQIFAANQSLLWEGHFGVRTEGRYACVWESSYFAGKIGKEKGE